VEWSAARGLTDYPLLRGIARTAEKSIQALSDLSSRLSHNKEVSGSVSNYSEDACTVSDEINTNVASVPFDEISTIENAKLKQGSTHFSMAKILDIDTKLWQDLWMKSNKKWLAGTVKEPVRKVTYDYCALSKSKGSLEKTQPATNFETCEVANVDKPCCKTSARTLTNPELTCDKGGRLSIEPLLGDAADKDNLVCVSP